MIVCRKCLRRWSRATAEPPRQPQAGWFCPTWQAGPKTPETDPPYDRLVALWCLADAEDQAETAIKRVADRLGRVAPAPYRGVGPAPAPMRRLRRQHRWQLLLKTARVGATLAQLDQILTDTASGKARFNVDVDPVHLL